MSWLSDPNAWIAFATLVVLELVLGIDNIVFLTILSDRLPAAQRPKARKIGLILAMAMRILLLLSLSWLMRLTATLFEAFGHPFSGKDLILVLGGLFLLAKSTHEIHQKLEGESGSSSAGVGPSFTSVILQIVLLDVVFSLDSVITAVGMVDNLGVMISAVVVSVVCMMGFARPVGDFVQRHPTVKMLALSFLLLIGVTLIADGFRQHIPKGYIYFSMAFSIFVEMLNIRVQKGRQAPVTLHEPYKE